MCEREDHTVIVDVGPLDFGVSELDVGAWVLDLRARCGCGGANRSSGANILAPNKRYV